MRLLLLALGDVAHDRRKTRQPPARRVHGRDVDVDIDEVPLLMAAYDVAAQALALAQPGIERIVLLLLPAFRIQRLDRLADDLLGAVAEQRLGPRIPRSHEA